MLYWDHLRPGLAAAVTLALTVFCLQASAQDYLAIEQRTLVAQAGSTGGSIGKKDKSISDGGEQRSSTPEGSLGPQIEIRTKRNRSQKPFN